MVERPNGGYNHCGTTSTRRKLPFTILPRSVHDDTSCLQLEGEGPIPIAIQAHRYANEQWKHTKAIAFP
jgi:hypothetical protein